MHYPTNRIAHTTIYYTSCGAVGRTVNSYLMGPLCGVDLTTCHTMELRSTTMTIKAKARTYFRGFGARFSVVYGTVNKIEIG